MKRLVFLIVWAVVGVVSWLAVAGCRRCGRKSENVVVVYTSVDQPFSEPVFKAFEKKTKISVRAVYDTEETKSTGLLNRLIAEAGHPQADVFWSNDPVRSQVLVKRGLVVRYRPPTASDVPAQFKAVDGSWVGFSARARVFLVNRERVSADQMPVSMKDMIDPKWKGKVAMANPAFGTTTMHMAALFSRWGSGRAAAFLAALRKNGVRVASSNGEVKRLVVAGEVAWGLTDSDDAAVAVRSGAKVMVVYPKHDDTGTLFMPTTAVLIKKAPHSANGRRLMDFLASREVERILAFAPCAQMPLREGVKTPKHVPRAGAFETMTVDYGRIAEVLVKIHPYLQSWGEGRDVSPPFISSEGNGARPRPSR